jgi:hypothetical protein
MLRITTSEVLKQFKHETSNRKPQKVTKTFLENHPTHVTCTVHYGVFSPASNERWTQKKNTEIIKRFSKSIFGISGNFVEVSTSVSQADLFIYL